MSSNWLVLHHHHHHHHLKLAHAKKDELWPSAPAPGGEKHPRPSRLADVMLSFPSLCSSDPVLLLYPAHCYRLLVLPILAEPLSALLHVVHHVFTNHSVTHQASTLTQLSFCLPIHRCSTLEAISGLYAEPILLQPLSSVVFATPDFWLGSSQAVICCPGSPTDSPCVASLEPNRII